MNIQIEQDQVVAGDDDPAHGSLPAVQSGRDQRRLPGVTPERVRVIGRREQDRAKLIRQEERGAVA